MNEIISPDEYLEYTLSLKNKKLSEIDRPGSLICSWSSPFIKKISGALNARPAAYSPWGSSLYIAQSGSSSTGLMTLPVGAPHTILNLELMAACGVTSIITTGICGTLRKDLYAGDIIIPEFSIRDEGTSFHYIKSEDEIKPDESLLSAVKKGFATEKTPFTGGGIWTTDGFFRETESRRNECREKGCTAVDMESSAVFAFGFFRKIKTCSILIVSDNIAESWKPDFDSEKIGKSFDLIQNVLLKMYSPE